MTVNCFIFSYQVKRTSAWNKACEELKKHQELLTAASSNETEQRNPLRPDSELRHRGDLMSPDQESRHTHRLICLLSLYIDVQIGIN